jgi:hypothetical protein
MLTRPPKPPDDKLRHRRSIRSRSAARGRRGDWFWRREITKIVRSRLVAYGHVRGSEMEDRAGVEAALDAIIDEALHLRR